MQHLQGLFAAGRPVIGICAAGILVRALASSLSDKRKEPPVLAVAEDGSTIVPLLGGHHGANEMARQISLRLGGIAAITTAGDLRFNVALDDPPEGWVLANPEDSVHFVAEMLTGARICFTNDDVPPFLRQLPSNREGPLRITVTTRCDTGDHGHLVYHPRQLAIGVGCGKGG